MNVGMVLNSKSGGDFIIGYNGELPREDFFKIGIKLNGLCKIKTSKGYLDFHIKDIRLPSTMSGHYNIMIKFTDNKNFKYIKEGDPLYYVNTD